MINKVYPVSGWTAFQAICWTCSFVVCYSSVIHRTILDFTFVKEKILNIHAMKPKETTDYTRKDFLRTAGSTALFAVLGISFASCSSVTDPGTDSNGQTDVDPSDPDSPITIDGNTITLNLDSDELENLRSQGGWLLISEANTLVVNVDGETLRSFTSVCTHAGCSTNWNFNGSRFTCTCHNSQFNTSGEVVQGPANRDLEEFDVERDDNIVVITK